MKSFFGSLVVGALLFGALTTPALPQDAPDLLLPDLDPLRPTDLDITDEAGVKTLRFTTEILNKGRGPLELRPEKSDCDDDGNFDNDRLAYQRVFVDSAADGYDRDVDIEAMEQPAGCQHFHKLHEHWHFDDFGIYKLLRYNSTGVLNPVAVAKADKISFCMVDTYRKRPELVGSPESGHYKAAENSDCGADTWTGISIGWVDAYFSYLDGQSLPIEGLPNGLYCLRVRSDPNKRLDESNDANNRAGVRLRIRGTEVLSPKRVGCAT